jgi:5-methylcytosine-specific restriction protein B
MDNLNNAIIESTIGGLNKHYQIGGAYFLKLNELDNDFDELWKYHLEPLLFSYFQGDNDADEKIEKLHDAYLNGNIENAYHYRQ